MEKGEYFWHTCDNGIDDMPVLSIGALKHKILWCVQELLDFLNNK